MIKGVQLFGSLQFLINSLGGRRRPKLGANLQADADLIQASGYFDDVWYRETYQDVAISGIPSLVHYVKFGWKEGRSPGRRFNSPWYLRQYPDIQNIDPLIHYLRFGQFEGRHPLPPDGVLAIAEAVLKEVKDLDPAFYTVNYLDDPHRLRIVDGSPNTRMASVYKSVIDSLVSPPEFIVFLPWLRHGGADLVASHAIKAMTGSGSKRVLTVLTDDIRMEARHLIPDHVPVLSLSAICSELTGSERTELVSLLIRSFAPRAILNINSRAAWEATELYGHVLSHFTRMYATLFCPDYLDDGRRIGYSDQYLSSCLPILDGIYFDNATHIRELVRRFHIPVSLREKLVLLYQPAVASPPRHIVTRDKFKVLWAGRLARQKNIKLLMDILSAAPVDIEFHIWGRGNPEYERELRQFDKTRPNIFFQGSYEHFSALSPERYDALLYTSLWDGIPNVILEGAAAGLPVVASHVGGIGEVVNGQTGWLIEDVHDRDAYIEALTSIRRDPKGTYNRLQNMYEKLNEQHSWEKYLDVLKCEPKSSGGLIAEKTEGDRFNYRPSRRPNSTTVDNERPARNLDRQ